MDPRTLCGPKHSSEVVRIFHAVENDQQRRLMPVSSFHKNRVFRLIGLC
jgi:hypothetical protein